MITTIRAPAFSSASAARSGSSSPVITSASAALARTSRARGRTRWRHAAASARERHRCRRRFGSNTTGRPSRRPALVRASSPRARSRADERVRGDEQRRRRRTAVSSRPPSARAHGGDRVAVHLVARLAARRRPRRSRPASGAPGEQLEQRQLDALASQPVAEPAAPGVVTRAAGEGDVRAVRGPRSPRRSRPRRRNAGTNASRVSATRSSGRSQMRSTSASPRHEGRRPGRAADLGSWRSRARTLSSPAGARRRAHDQPRRVTRVLPHARTAPGVPVAVPARDSRRARTTGSSSSAAPAGSRLT